MLTLLRHRLTYANVVATLALFVALGGTAYAGAYVGTGQVKNHSLRGVDIKKDSLTGKQVKESTLGTVPSAGTLNGLSADSFERASRNQFGRGTGSPASPAAEVPVIEWSALGVRVTVPAQGGCSDSQFLTLHAFNTNTSGGDVHLHGGLSIDSAIGSGGSTIACSPERRRWIGALTRDGDSRVLFFTCLRLGGDVACHSTRSTS